MYTIFYTIKNIILDKLFQTVFSKPLRKEPI